MPRDRPDRRRMLQPPSSTQREGVKLTRYKLLRHVPGCEGWRLLTMDWGVFSGSSAIAGSSRLPQIHKAEPSGWMHRTKSKRGSSFDSRPTVSPSFDQIGRPTLLRKENVVWRVLIEPDKKVLAFCYFYCSFKSRSQIRVLRAQNTSPFHSF